MRWALSGVLLGACAGSTESVDVPATVVHVEANSDCGATACGPIYLGTMCGYDLPFIEPMTQQVVAYTGYGPSELAGLAQLQYTGTLAYQNSDGTPDHLDYSLADGDHADVYALGQYDESWLLYRLDAQGGVSDIDTARLVAAEGSTLHFAYGGITEDHVVDKPRTVNAQIESPCLCSVGGPGELGLVLAAALIPLRRRRRGGGT